jgi:hypothetical protein
MDNGVVHQDTIDAMVQNGNNDATYLQWHYVPVDVLPPGLSHVLSLLALGGALFPVNFELIGCWSMTPHGPDVVQSTASCHRTAVINHT